MWEEAVERVRAIGAAEMPEFQDAYAHRRWDAAQFRSFGETTFDKSAQWLSSQTAHMRSVISPLIKLLAVRWDVYLHDPCNVDGGNGERRDRIISHIRWSTAVGDALLAELDTAFLPELHERRTRYPRSADEQARHAAVTGV